MLIHALTIPSLFMAFIKREYLIFVKKPFLYLLKCMIIFFESVYVTISISWLMTNQLCIYKVNLFMMKDLGMWYQIEFVCILLRIFISVFVRQEIGWWSVSVLGVFIWLWMRVKCWVHKKSSGPSFSLSWINLYYIFRSYILYFIQVVIVLVLWSFLVGRLFLLQSLCWLWK